MTNLKITLAAAMLLCGTAVFAGNPKTDAKTNTKAPAKVEAKATTTNSEKAKDQTFTYYVTSKETVNGVLEYTVTTQQQTCLGGTDPCKIETNQQADSQNRVPASAITSILLTQSL